MLLVSLEKYFSIIEFEKQNKTGQLCMAEPGNRYDNISYVDDLYVMMQVHHCFWLVLNSLWMLDSASCADHKPSLKFTWAEVTWYLLLFLINNIRSYGTFSRPCLSSIPYSWILMDKEVSVHYAEWHVIC